jgi:hypothetical protein
MYGLLLLLLTALALALALALHVKFGVEQATKAQRGSRATILPFP